MPLLDDTGRPAVDLWTTVADDQPLPAGKAVLSLGRLAALGDEAGGGLGVRLAPDTRPEAVLPHLGRVEMVAIEFPKFRDGRGFTLARTLRERYGYRGDIRAVGHVLPDQSAALLDCGFSTVLVPDSQPAERWAEALAGAHGPRPAVQLFHRLVPRPPIGLA